MKTLHMIGNAHLDPVWLWNWREGYQENLATFYSAVQRLEEFDDVVFTSSSAQFYEWLEEASPELFDKIRGYVREGRWIFCGGWWVQPDCNLPGGESFARHALISQNYFREKFGVISHVGYNVDSFGHNANIPAILKNSGMDAYVFMRPGPHENQRIPGQNFIWEAPDGSRIPVFRIMFAYCTFNNLREHMEKHCEKFDPWSEHLMCFYGVGNHGGGPTIDNIHTIHEEQKKQSDIRIVFDSPQSYFEQTREEQKHWPVVTGDLLHHASGCYSAVSKVKEWCRKTEHELLRAEKFSALDGILTGGSYPADYDRAWKNLLFNQFHDIMAGSAIESAYEDTWKQLGEARSIADRNENAALQRTAFRVNIPFEPDMMPLTVFNPHGFQVRQVVEFEPGLGITFRNHPVSEQILLTDSTGRDIPCQRIVTESKTPDARRIAFAAEVPAMGYETYRIRFKKTDGQADTQAYRQLKEAEAGRDVVLENDLVRVVFSGADGNISSYYDKAEDREYLKAPVQWVVCEDRSDTWSHDVFTFRDFCGTLKTDHIWLGETGPVRKSVITESSWGSSTVRQKFILDECSKGIKVECSVDWHEQYKCLKICFPLALEQAKWICQVPFGATERSDGKENPVQEFCDVSGINNGARCGVTLYTGSKSSCDYYEGGLYLTVLRSPAYAQHNPYVLNEKEPVKFIDQGEQRFVYAVGMHDGDCPRSDAVKNSLLISEPLVLLPQSCHEGTLPEKYCGLQCGCSHVAVTAFKRARDNGGYILRLYETDGEAATVPLALPGLHVQTEVEVKPHEIVSLYIADDTHMCRKVNFLEW